MEMSIPGEAVLLTGAELTQDLQFQGTAVTGRGTEMRPLLLQRE